MRVHHFALALAILLAFSCGQTRATETTRSALQTQNLTNIVTNGAGQISATTINSLLANIIDSTGVLQSNQTWTGQNNFAGDSTFPAVIKMNGGALEGLSSFLTGANLSSASLQFAGRSADFGGSVAFLQYSSDASSAFVNFSKSRSTTKGATNGAVQNLDEIGEVNFNASDGTNFISAANNTAVVDGAVSPNIIPIKWTWDAMNASGQYDNHLTLRADAELIVGDATNNVRYNQIHLIPGLVGSATPTIFSTGGAGGATLGLDFKTQNSGNLNFSSTSGANPIFTMLGSANAVDYLTVKGGSAGNPILGTAGTSANIDILLQPKGTGRVVFSQFVVDGYGCLTGASGRFTVGATGCGVISVANGGTGTATPATVAGTNISVSGSFPNQTINSRLPSALLQEQQASGTDGGECTSGAWQTRVLNTEVFDTNSLISLAANEFTPTQNGIVQWSAPAVNVNAHQTRLYNVTDAAVAGYGSSAQSLAASGVVTLSVGSATVLASKAYRLEHQCETTVGVFGFGLATGFAGTTEVFSQVNYLAVGN